MTVEYHIFGVSRQSIILKKARRQAVRKRWQPDRKAQAGKSRFHREVRRTRRRMKKSVKGIGELCRKGMDGTDTHIDGKAFWQACCHGAAVWEKEQDEGRQEDDIYINPQ